MARGPRPRPQRASPGYSWARRHRLPGANAESAWAFQERLEESQWNTADQHAARQRQLLRPLLDHARAQVPWYRERLAGLDLEALLEPEGWRTLPVLTRTDLQAHEDALTAEAVPAGHGTVSHTHSSGSTGRPVRVAHTALSSNWHNALSFRTQLWAHKRFDTTLAAVRYYKAGVGVWPEGFSGEAWADELTLPVRSGPVHGLSMRTPLHLQAEWLEALKPRVLVSFPTNLMALAQHLVDTGRRIGSVRRIMTVGEAHPEGLRGMARRAFGAEIFDTYSAYEVGAIALQCPEHEAFHVQAESLKVEVLGADGRVCAPGETGRVVVTPLHNYAMPLLRYEIGDYATVGGPCRCGRGLPVLTRVMGRHRNMMRLPDGSEVWPSFAVKRFADIAPVSQAQFVQHTIDRLEGRLVADRPLSEAEEEAIREVVRTRLPAPFQIDFSYPDAIERGPGGKFEEFVSRVGDSPSG